MDQPKQFRIGEHFLSVQGEGPTMGRPSLFIRTVGCVLDCRWCDSASVWKTKGTTYAFQDFAELLAREYREFLTCGNARLILTGGSPLMQADAFAALIEKLYSWFSFKVEVETEAVLCPGSFPLDLSVAQYNVSPKLSHSGMPEPRRLVARTLAWHAEDFRRSIFKFVVSCVTDMEEIEKIRSTYGIRANRIWLMPLAVSRAHHIELGPSIAALAKNYGYNYSPRLHILTWDKATGV